MAISAEPPRALDRPAESEAAIGGEAALDLILIELRRLALRALDAGHPMAAAQIAATADRLQPALPARPDDPEETGRR